MLEDWKRLGLRVVREAADAVKSGLRETVCVECVECGEQFCRRFLKEDVMAVERERLESKLRAAARSEGWTVEDGSMECPECTDWTLAEVEDDE